MKSGKGGGRRPTYVSGKKHGEHSAELHGETSGGRVVGDLVAQAAHDVVAVEDEAELDAETAVRENPGGHGRLGAGDGAVLPNVEHRRDGADSVRDLQAAFWGGWVGG